MNFYSLLATAICLTALGVYFLPGNPFEGYVAKDVAMTASKFVYLFSVALSTGVANWHSFVFGLVAWKVLEKPTMSQLQTRLFPVYFQILVLSNSAALFGFSSLRTGANSRAEEYQIYILVAGLISWLSNLLVFEPMTSTALQKRYKFVREEESAEGKDIKDHPKYKELSKTFGMWHGCSASVNLVGIVCIHMHLWYMATTLVSF